MPVTLREVEVRPIPQTLLGFGTREEQLAAQDFFRTASNEEAERYLDDLRPRIEKKLVLCIRPETPQLPAESTSWTRRARGKPVSEWLMDAVTDLES